MSKQQDNKTGLWFFLALSAVLFSAMTLWDYGLQQSPNLLPLWGALIYYRWRVASRGRKTLSADQGIVLIAVAWILSWGMVYGPLQLYSWANHFSHFLAAAIVALLAANEFLHLSGLEKLQANQKERWGVKLLVIAGGVGTALALGVSMELAEALVHWNYQPGEMMPLDRFHDTAWDLGADLWGGLVGAAAAPLLNKQTGQTEDKHLAEEEPADPSDKS